MNKWNVLGVAAAAGLLCGAARAQLVVGNDSSTGQLWVIDLATPANTRQIGTGTDYQINGLAADNAGGMLYWIDSSNRLMRAPMVTSGTLTPTFVGTTNIGGTTVTVSSLAYDSADGQLVMYKNSTTGGPEGFYAVNTATAACTLLWAVTDTTDDYGGIDYDPATNAFYGCNDSTTAGNRGLYRVNKPWSSPTMTFLAAYPNSDTDVDGAAAGNGRVYLVNDTAAQGAYVYNISTATYESTVALPYTANNVNSGGAWAPGLLVPPTGADVSITKTDAPDPVVVPPGGNITYTVTVRNNGPDAATGVTVTDVLPGNVTFVSVGSPGVHNNGVITANIGSMTNGQEVVFTIVVTPNGLGSVTNIAGVSTTSNDPNSANNSASATTTVRSPLADVSAGITPPADCSVAVGGDATFQFSISNAGPETADGSQLVVTFPANVSFVSSSPPLTPSGSTLTLATGSMGTGGSASLSATFTVNSGTSVVMGATASTSTADPNGGNNTAGATLNVPASAPTSAPITGVISTIAASPTSDVPGIAGAKFANNGLLRPYRSPDGTKWIMNANTNLATTQDEVILVGNVGGSISAPVQEGVTFLDLGDFVGPIDAALGINDAGQFAFGTNTDTATTQDEVIVKWTETSLVTVAREANSCPAIAGASYGATSDSASIQQDGTVSFYTSMTGTTGTSDDTAYLTDDGATVVSREGVTVPTSQANDTTYTCEVLSTGATEGAGLFMRSDGAHSCGLMELITLATSEDKILVVDNDVKIQEGHPVPGSAFTSGVASASPLTNQMESDGTWMSYGSNIDGQDWVVRDGVVVAQTGGEVTPGSGLTWGDSSYAQTFFYASSNTSGDYVVAGVFNGPVISNAAIVANGSTMIARENDPIDLDGNGVFDDGYYIRTFIDDRIFMTSDAVYCVVRVRDAAAALCTGTDTDRGQALIRIPLPPRCDPDYNQDGNADQDDVSYLINVIGGGGNPSGRDPDFTGDGNSDQDDVSALINTIGGGGCP